jgi:hypothetical protein
LGCTTIEIEQNAKRNQDEKQNQNIPDALVINPFLGIQPDSPRTKTGKN